MNCCMFFIKSFIYFFLSSQELHHAYLLRFLSSCRFNLLLGTYLLFLHLLIRKPFSHGTDDRSHHQFAGTVMSSQDVSSVQPCHTMKHDLFERSSVYFQLKRAIEGGRSQEDQQWQESLTSKDDDR